MGAILKAGSGPKIICVTIAPETEANITGKNPMMVYSINTTSIAKITPAMGVLKDAEMAAATPQPAKVRKLLWGNLSHWPNWLAVAAPK